MTIISEHKGVINFHLTRDGNELSSFASIQQAKKIGSSKNSCGWLSQQQSETEQNLCIGVTNGKCFEIENFCVCLQARSSVSIYTQLQFIMFISGPWGLDTEFRNK